MDESSKLAAAGAGAHPGAATALLLPGMSLNATVFPDLGVPAIVAAFNRFDGRTPGPAAGRSGAMQAYVDEVDRLVRTPRWETAGRRIVVGHSFGGMLALAWLAARGTAGIDGLVLIGTTAGPMYDVARLRVGGFGSRAWRVPLGPLMPLWGSGLVTALVKRVLAGGGERDVDFQRYAGRSELAIGMAGWRVTTSAAKRSYRAAMDGFDARRHLAGIDIPAVVLHGTRDVYFAPALARALADGLPRAELRLVEGAGHVLPLSHPADVQRAVAALR